VFLGTWQLVDIQYEYEIYSFNLADFAAIISNDKAISKSEVLDYFKGLRLKFTETSYRFFKSIDNTFCSGNITEVTGLYEYEDQNITFFENSILADTQSPEASEKYIIEEQRLKIIHTENGESSVFVFEKE